MNAVRAAINRSAQTFKAVVWPRVQEILGPYQLIPVEDVTDSHMAKTLDVMAGIDAWWVMDAEVYGVASRVQYEHDWRTFTIRSSLPSGAPTELQKRKRALKRGALVPRYTIQAYVSHDTGLLSAAIAPTDHLISTALRLQPTSTRINRDGSKFVVVRWDQLDHDKVLIIDRRATD